MRLNKGVFPFSSMLVLILTQLLIWNACASQPSAKNVHFKPKSSHCNTTLDRQRANQKIAQLEKITRGNCIEIENAFSQAKFEVVKLDPLIRKCLTKVNLQNESTIILQEQYNLEAKKCKEKDVCPICPEKDCPKEECKYEECICPTCQAQRPPCEKDKQCEICKQKIEPECPSAPICDKCQQTECEEIVCPPEKICQVWDDPEPCICHQCPQVHPCPPQQIKQCPKHTCLEQKTCPSFECHVDCKPLNDQIADLESKVHEIEPKIELITKAYDSCKTNNKESIQKCEVKISQSAAEINGQFETIIRHIEKNLPATNNHTNLTETKQLLKKSLESIKATSSSETVSIYKQLASELLIHLKSLAVQTQAIYTKLGEGYNLGRKTLDKLKACEKVLRQ